jgi:hypothetical protein
MFIHIPNAKMCPVPRALGDDIMKNEFIVARQKTPLPGNPHLPARGVCGRYNLFQAVLPREGGGLNMVFLRTKMSMTPPAFKSNTDSGCVSLFESAGRE